MSDSCTTRPTVSASGLAALVVTCALPVYAGVRRKGVTALITAALLSATSTGAWLTVLQPVDEPPPRPHAQPTGYWTLPTGSRLAYTHLPAEGVRRSAAPG
ncbi:hypothetical protein [Streptomyces sp. NPDC051677]|uniref:hypothetical protein n=1 Tax=Streptomyces sp. NPDC051677 TaxID=3365669 RepID=UPI0037D51966